MCLGKHLEADHISFVFKLICDWFWLCAGTGASCIYPLLGATMNGWFFLATEVDDICFNYAKKNVEQNHLTELIKGRWCVCVRAHACVMQRENLTILNVI